MERKTKKPATKGKSSTDFIQTKHIPSVEYRTYKWESTGIGGGELEASILKSQEKTLNELEWFLKGMKAGRTDNDLSEFIIAVGNAKREYYNQWLKKMIEQKEAKSK